MYHAKLSDYMARADILYVHMEILMRYKTGEGGDNNKVDAC